MNSHSSSTSCLPWFQDVWSELWDIFDFCIPSPWWRFNMISAVWDFFGFSCKSIKLEASWWAVPVRILCQNICHLCSPRKARDELQHIHVRIISNHSSQNSKQFFESSPTKRFRKLRGWRRAKIGDCGDSSCLKVRWMKAKLHRVSPSEARKVMWILVSSFKLSIPVRTFLITSACCAPDSRLQSPDTRRGWAEYSRLSLHSRPRVAIVSLKSHIYICWKWAQFPDTESTMWNQF